LKISISIFDLVVVMLFCVKICCFESLLPGIKTQA
jgi:hypothetical protein